MRLAPEETSIELTGFEHNAVTCVGMKTILPVSFCFHCTRFCLFFFGDHLLVLAHLILDMFKT